MNILVGDNDAGKSTLLEAIGLALTGRYRGRLLSQELSPYLFSKQVVEEYLEGLREGLAPALPELIIDLFFQPSDDLARLQGTNNLLKLDEPGVRVRASFNREYIPEYTVFAKDPSRVRLLPTEYYRVDWLDFGGNPVTRRSIPASASLIDASAIQLQNGVDFYLNSLISEHLDPVERVRLTRAYRGLREAFSADDSIKKINERLQGRPDEVSDRELTLGMDVSQRSGWESSVVPHLDDIPLQYVGKGEQSSVKILLALKESAAEAHVVLVEEPENHLSFANLGRLVKKIQDRCNGQQVFIATHSSFVLNKLGLDKLVLLSSAGGARLTQLPATTLEHFRKLSGYDTLRLVLAQKTILVEGPSDELIVQRAFCDIHGCMPLEMGVDVIDARGTTFKRFLDIAVLLPERKVAVVRDNDGVDEADMVKRYAAYTVHPNISVHVGKDKDWRTLEPQLVKANGVDVMNAVLGTAYVTEQELIKYMLDHKTDCAQAVFSSATTITMPEYILDAIAA